MDQTDRNRIRVFLNDPAGRGDCLVDVAPPAATEQGRWAFRVEGGEPPPRAYAPDTLEFLHWQLAYALDRGKRWWNARLPRPGAWTPGPVLPAVPVAGKDLNAFYDRQALRFFRGADVKTGAPVASGDSVDVAVHEQGHAVLDAIRPDLWDAPHFEVAAFHEAFGDLASIFVALAEPVLDADVVGATRGDPARSNLVSRLAEELGRAVRDDYGADAAPPGALRDAVNRFLYQDPKTLPDSAPETALSAEPHAFCRVMTGACWDVLVAVYRASAGRDRAAALAAASERVARWSVAAADTAPSGADFFGRVARRIVREAAGEDRGLAAKVGAALFRRRLLESPDVPAELSPDEDPQVPAPPEGGDGSPALVRAVAARLGPERGALLARGTRGAPFERAASLRVFRGRRRRDLFLRGREYGPADGAAVELSDSFALAFGAEGFLRASRVAPAGDRDAEDARAFVRFLARRGRIADASSAPPDSVALARARKSHAVVRDADGVRRLRRVWMARKERPR
ncbi:MAG TPA: hypothetical protein VMH79_01935 [Thermoanaerobaculia bacterium]|nr:hypothetical protein [Thermoanaerobaculia bacterium]